MSRQHVQVDVMQPTCPRCGSTKRTKYHNQRTLCDVTVRGVRYAKLVLRRCECKDCGQCRVERVLFQNKSAERSDVLEQYSDDS